MKLSEILIEEATPGAVGAHSVAGSRGSLFGGGMLPTKMLKRMTPPGGSILKLKNKKRNKVAGVPVIRYENEA